MCTHAHQTRHADAEIPAHCPMEGRMAVALACGFHEEAIDMLRKDSAALPRHTQRVVDKLSQLDQDRASAVMDNYQTAVARICFRMKQSFSYWTQLPWSLLMLARPFVDRFENASQARAEFCRVQSLFLPFAPPLVALILIHARANPQASDCLQECRMAGKLLVASYDAASNKAALGAS